MLCSELNFRAIFANLRTLFFTFFALQDNALQKVLEHKYNVLELHLEAVWKLETFKCNVVECNVVEAACKLETFKCNVM